MAGIYRHNHGVILADATAGAHGAGRAGHRGHRIGIKRIGRGGTRGRHARRGDDRCGLAARHHRRFTGNGKDHAVVVAVALSDRPGFPRLGQFKHQPHALLVLWGTAANAPDDVLTAEVQR